MRRRLSLLVVAVTSMVVLSFVVPLGIAVRDQAEARSLSRAQRNAQSVASGLAVAAALADDGTVSPLVAELVVQTGGDPTTTVFLPDTSVGAPADRDLADRVADSGRAITLDISDGAAVFVPVSTSGGTLVVMTVVSQSDLRSGVWAAWLGLGVLGILLVGAAAALADRLGRDVVRPVSSLAAATRRMAAGDPDVRVEPAGPVEIEDAGRAFNQLADRLDDLLAAERESVADLSHKLRTPLTAVRLQAELVSRDNPNEALVAAVDRLGHQVDALIEEARRPATGAGQRRSDLASVVRERVEYWSALAEDEGRDVSVDVKGSVPVGVPGDELATLVDILVDNVFTHTPPGTPYAVGVMADLGGGGVLMVEDAGPGLADDGVIERGRSGGSGSGLGLDIVQRACLRSGGELIAGSSASGGARLEARFGPVGGSQSAAVQGSDDTP